MIETLLAVFALLGFLYWWHSHIDYTVPYPLNRKAGNG